MTKWSKGQVRVLIEGPDNTALDFKDWGVLEQVNKTLKEEKINCELLVEVGEYGTILIFNKIKGNKK